MTAELDPAADGFLSRWARRKAQVRDGVVDDAAPAAAVVAPLLAAPPIPEAASPAALAAPSPPAEPPPTLADVALLTRDSDYSRFVGNGVDSGVTQAAMKKLFADPHFNVMDGLDTYIDDYGKPDPIPLAMLKQMNQSKFLKLFDDEEEDEKKSAETPLTEATPEPKTPPDDDADLRLQQDDAARRPGPDQGAGA